MWFQRFTFMKDFWLVFSATEKNNNNISKVFLNSRLFRVFLPSFSSSKFILQLPNLSSFSFLFNFSFQLSICLLYTAIQDLWNKALFSRTDFLESYISHGKPSKLWNLFKLSAVVWNKLFSESKLEKQILHVIHKVPITGFTLPSLKISKKHCLTFVDPISWSCS